MFAVIISVKISVTVSVKVLPTCFKLFLRLKLFSDAFSSLSSHLYSLNSAPFLIKAA